VGARSRAIARARSSIDRQQRRTPSNTSKKGEIKIVVASEQGKEAVIAVLGPAAFFGEGCLVGQPLRLATAKPAAPC
jgi:Cyclic nucleotide-binding domain